MITQQSKNYAKILVSLQIKEEIVVKSKEILLNSNVLMEALENPAISKKEKETVIDQIFDKEITSFLKVLTNNKLIATFAEIMDAYEELLLEQKNILKAKLTYTVKLDEEQLEEIKTMLCQKYNKSGVYLEMEEDPSLIGGFVLYTGNTEYDKSIKGALSELQNTLIRRRSA
jgi:F-type H+-transporting ATPase subunit delta